MATEKEGNNKEKPKKEMGDFERMSKMFKIDLSRYVPAQLPSNDEILDGLVESIKKSLGKIENPEDKTE